jgi:hypothetical protein
VADRRASVEHDRHDLELIARVAAGDGSPADALAAETVRADCGECRQLDADLRSIATATRALANDTAAVRAPRDFRLTPKDAARLHGRRLAGLFPARLGGGLVALGLVGILFGSGIVGVFSGFGSAGAAAPAQQTTDERFSGAPGAVFAPAQSPASSGYAAAVGRDGATTGGGARDATRGDRSNSWVLIVSGAAIAAGLGILLAARNGQRAGP